MKYYCIKDALVGFGDLVMAENDAVAERRFRGVMESAAFKENKADYSLYYIGEFNEHTGDFKTEGAVYITGGTING